MDVLILGAICGSPREALVASRSAFILLLLVYSGMSGGKAGVAEASLWPEGSDGLLLPALHAHATRVAP